MNLNFRPYLDLIRFRQPIGSALLILPCLFALSLIFKTNANIESSKFINHLILFTLGGFLMRSAGCIINDLFDKNFDKKVARTKNRPLASQKISVKNSIIFLLILLFLALLILLQFNIATIIAGFVALGLVIIYPLPKRLTNFPQVFLGITFNFGIILVSFALTNQINAGVIILYLACIFWTIFYDTIYGFQDIEDDLRIGLKSTSITFSKNNPKNILWRISTIATLFFVMLGTLEEFGLIYFVIIIFAGIFMVIKIHFCNLQNPKSCLKLFKQNLYLGLIFLIAILLG